MNSSKAGESQGVWSMTEWARLERRTSARVLQCGSEAEAWRTLVRQGRRVMRAYTTSFFIVSRFLPKAKRDEVEAIYAAVRYPDEVVDNFPLDARARLLLLDQWQSHYETGIDSASLREALRRGVPAHLAGFTRVVRERAIAAEYYRSRRYPTIDTDTKLLCFETRAKSALPCLTLIAY